MVRRAWKEQHRSWILFLDDIKTHPDVISGEIDGNIYLFDCESARLSIWSEKWETFTDVGVSRLIRQERISMEGHIAPREKGAHIFYKGIELQKKYVERDSELIEFIDIKKELSRNLINLSRGGFTREGEKFLESELYPGLLEAIQSVLHDLESQNELGADGKRKFKVSEIITKNIIKKCDFIADKLNHRQENSKELLECENDLTVLVVSSAVLAYFAIREQWTIYSKMSGYHAPRGNFWFEFLDQIDEILQNEKYEKVMRRLAESTSFFNLKVYDEKGEPYLIRGSRNEGGDTCCFLNIFQKNNHWAILQTRKNQMSSWTSYLIFFPKEHWIQGEENEEGKSVDEIYRQITEIPHNTDDAFLEVWSQPLLTASEHSGFAEDHTGANKNYTGGQQFVLNWILKNVPTVALFSDKTGNIRLNVLSSNINPSIYMNNNFKFLLVSRLLEKAQKENNKRFATVAWQGTEYLSCKNLSKYVLFVKRGYLSEYSYREVVVPYDKTTLKKWSLEIEKGTLKTEILPKLRRLFDEMNIIGYVREFPQSAGENGEDAELKEFLSTTETDISPEVAWDLIELISVIITREDYCPQTTFIDLLNGKEGRALCWKQIYRAILNNYVIERKKEREENNVAPGGEITEIANNPEFPSLCAAWYYFFKYRESVIAKTGLNKIKSDEAIRQSDPKEEKMIQYIKNNGYFHVDEEDIRMSLYKYKEEILEMVQNLELKDVQKEIRDFLKNYKFIL